MPPPIPPLPHGAGIPAKKPRNWWLIGCGGCLGVFMLGLLVSGIIYFSVSRMASSTEPYQMAVAAATSSPEVQEALGTPIKPGIMLGGSFSTNNNNGTITETAALTIPLKGPKASGSLHFSGRKADGKWETNELTITVEGSDRKIYLGPRNVEALDEK